MRAVALMDVVRPDWPADGTVQAFTTTRSGGVSQGSWSTLNLGDRTGDEAADVAENRGRFRKLLPSAPGWLHQVHGSAVVPREAVGDTPPEADAVWTSRPDLACTVLTADCLPILFCDRKATTVAAAHAGWRGLVGGVLEATIERLPAAPADLLAWIGPGIGPTAYEVGADFEAAFRARLPWLEVGFERIGGAVHADLPAIARSILRRSGVAAVYGGDFCTYTEAGRFFSHRREPGGGRMATTIWLGSQESPGHGPGPG